MHTAVCFSSIGPCVKGRKYVRETFIFLPMQNMQTLLKLLPWKDRLSVIRTKSDTFQNYMPNIVSEHVFTKIPYNFRWMHFMVCFLCVIYGETQVLVCDHLSDQVKFLYIKTMSRYLEPNVLDFTRFTQLQILRFDPWFGRPHEMVVLPCSLRTLVANCEIALSSVPLNVCLLRVHRLSEKKTDTFPPNLRVLYVVKPMDFIPLFPDGIEFAEIADKQFAVS